METRPSSWRDLLPQGRGLADGVWLRRHNILSVVLLAHVPLLYAFALSMDFHPWHAGWEVGLLAVAAAAGQFPFLPRILRETSVSVGLLASSALLVHLSGGYIETHFHFFVMLPLVAMYQRWQPFLVAVAFVVLHHGVVGVLEPASVYNHPAALADPWRWAGVHALFVSLECVTLFRLWREVEDSQDAADAARASASQLLEVQAVKERLLRVASHELATPLTPIRLQLSLMRNPAVRDDPERQAHSMAVLARNFGRLERMVASVLDAVRVDNDGIRLRPAPHDVAGLARDAFDAYSEVARMRGVTLEADVEPAPATVDAERISQVIDNLLSNAIKYTGEGGRVVLRVRPEERHVLVEVEDTGRGLDAGQVKRLFQPFGMVHDGEQSAEGTGLGLYICKGIVERHGGHLEVSSHGPGQGTRFWLRVPREQAVRRPRPVRPAATPGGRPRPARERAARHPAPRDVDAAAGE